MGERKTIAKKIIVIFIVFVLLFSSAGNTLFAIATSDEFEVISKGFFQKDEIKYKAYFEDENEKQLGEKISNVNEKINLILEINPQVEGFLKEGTIKAVSDDNSPLNFKIINIKAVDEMKNEVSATENKDESESISVDNKVELENTVVSNEIANEVSNKTENTVANEVSNETTNEISNEIVNEVSNKVSNEVDKTSSNVTNNVTNTNKVELDLVKNDEISSLTTTINDNNVSANEVNLNSAEEFVNEEQVILDKLQEKEDSENIDIIDFTSDNKILSDNEIKVSNITNDTKLIVELEYVQNDQLLVDSLCQNVKFQLSGTFINKDLEEVKIGKENNLTIGWKYSKDITLNSEYTKFSPFAIGNTTGTIVENKITLTRDVNEQKYLPLKSTNINVTVPDVNGKKPIAVDISASKLLATNGQDIGKVSFSQDNWSYDTENGIITINVNNGNDGKANYSFGSDEYVIIYRYSDYVDENSTLVNKITAKVEEYSAKENNIITKEINNEDQILVDIGELITYSIGTNEDKINRSFVNANYNSDISFYEAQYTNNVSLNILTSDLLEELKVDITKDVYKDINGTEFDAVGIAYKSIKFNYSDISALLSNGGELIITNKNGEVIGTLTKDLLVSEESANINLNDVNGVYVYIKNVSHDGKLSFEITKAIKKCNYEKSAFNNFASINSRITAEVKYSEFESPFKLKEIECSKLFENSTTEAIIDMNTNSLSSIEENSNVELKIELNNDKSNSDLYINPTFEIVFPKNVKEATIKSINLLHENGLTIKDYKVYQESDIVKLRIELDGTETNFVDSAYTNGTNIIVALNIKLDEYTSAKKDQIKLYYYNEGATNYSSQTKWSISKVIPKGILKETNGFDALVFDYKTPEGLIAVNTIKNYDGKLGVVKSVKQGDKTANITINDSAKIATMELLALNNTGNVCTDVTLLGRIPFAGNKDVNSKEDLKTNINTTITGLINTDVTNSNITEIYYSNNGDATNNLDSIENGWTKEPTDLSQIKSYLIIVKGTVQPGSILRFTYDFNIPEKLPYESKIEGSFGAFYYNNSDVAVVYESNIADRVGLTTEEGPKLNATISVDAGENNEVLSGKILKYTVRVKNTGSIKATGVEVKFTKPEYATFVDKDLPQWGDYGYIYNKEVEQIKTIDALNPGEEKEVSCFVRTSKKPSVEEYATGKDDNGYYIEKVVGYKDVEVSTEVDNDDEHKDEIIANAEEKLMTKEPIFEKEYITTVPDVFVTMKAEVSSAILANSIETSEIKNKLEKANFDSNIRIDYDRDLIEGMETKFSLVLTNISRSDLENVVVTFKIGDIYSFKDALLNDENDKVSFDETTKEINYNIGSMKKDEVAYLSNVLLVNQLNVESKVEDYYFNIKSNDISEESIKIQQTFIRPFLNAVDVSDTVLKVINENETITVSTKITNVGMVDSTEGVLEIDIPNEVIIDKIVDNKGTNLPSYNEDGKAKITIPGLKKDESTIIDVVYKAKNLGGTDNSNISVSRIVKNGSQIPIAIPAYSFTVVNNLKTDEEIEEEENKKVQETIDNTNKENQENSENNNNNAANDENNTQNSDSTENIAQDANDGETVLPNIENSGTENKNEINNNATTPTDISNNELNNTENNESEVENNYSISGQVWNDLNKDGKKDSDEAKIKGVTVQLFQNGVMTKVTSTENSGIYSFRNLEKGSYDVVFIYDGNQYVTTVYKATGVEANVDSDAIEVELGKAVTNSVQIIDSNIENIDMGLKEKDNFDLAINKYLVKSTVITSKNTKNVDYDNSEIAKIEIRSKELDGANVKVQYKFVVENKGLTSGYASKVLDQIPDGMNFDENENEGWYLGNDGILYNETLKDTVINPGEKKELLLVLEKNMTKDNTGVVSNKAMLEANSTKTDINDDVSNNVSTQEIIITVSTGGNIPIIVLIIIIMLLLIDIYIHRDKLDILSKYKYKNLVNKKIKTKKIYR